VEAEPNNVPASDSPLGAQSGWARTSETLAGAGPLPRRKGGTRRLSLGFAIALPQAGQTAKLDSVSRIVSLHPFLRPAWTHSLYVVTLCKQDTNAQHPDDDSCYSNVGRKHHSSVGRKHILRGSSEGYHAKGFQLQRESQAEPLCPRLHLGCSWDHRMVLCQNHSML
jgi:hypothetical protein